MDLKQLREENGIKAYKISEKLYINKAQFNDFENDIYKLSMLKIENLSEIHRKSIEEIEMACEGERDERRRNNI
ncbi:helix-turn-helix domain-containing protein [Clostridium beijerinckii]|uniref:Transcriptional regulator n=1 Tax=Clostridium beijerinckii TaxID=1520 RepID=A0A1S9N516_CLOBE|nr:helix-turn-helix transcriptional regulator [Clostridium beijerinckii]MZK51144.1 XRE family transcriptional regulator [Clostridium beijerinckii]MZK59346.1 XRE family transcriptional regulator [Clostridium beijerinckii]MZK69465.1 XRE family transcriptional regulator [Clostridium beijerinckii]MZK74838.1 XRE family transcriptional regulator [Clostridium beijerinckii]MZK84556.1 XRE family transcriptional regulator [Clostridium beijerinckii]